MTTVTYIGLVRPLMLLPMLGPQSSAYLAAWSFLFQGSAPNLGDLVVYMIKSSAMDCFVCGAKDPR
jgi:hypothetical protein